MLVASSNIVAIVYPSTLYEIRCKEPYDVKAVLTKIATAVTTTAAAAMKIIA